MTYREAIKFVRRLNEWRRGSEEIDQPDPREIGIALDILCDGLESSLEKLKAFPSSKLAFAELLAQHGIVQRGAVDDAEDYDGGETLDRIYSAHEDLLKGFASCECGNEHLQQK